MALTHGDRGEQPRSPALLEGPPASSDLANTSTADLLSELLTRLKKLEEENRSLQSDVQDQAAGREEWMNRARRAEFRQTAKPYVMAFIDGNDVCFRNRFIRAGKDGAIEAATLLHKEIRDHANLHHKNDLPRGIAIVVQVFLDVDKLASDLIAAEAIKEQSDLRSFLQHMSSQPLVSIINCEARTVQQKISESYELHLENCHCQHTILALGRASEYYSVLAEYAEDEYTKLKTSLIRPGGGFPANHSLPFYQAKLSAIHDVPLIPLLEDNASELFAALPQSLTTLVRAKHPKPLPSPPSSGTSRHGKPSSTISMSLESVLPEHPEGHSTSPAQDSHRASLPEELSKDHQESTLEPGQVPSRFLALTRIRAAESPSRQQDWETDPGPHNAPGNLPSNQGAQDHPAVSPVRATRSDKQDHESYASRRALASPVSPVRHQRGATSPLKSPRLPAPITASRGRFLPAPPTPQWLPGIPIRNDILRNRHGQRIDGPLPSFSKTDYRDFRALRTSRNFCNDYHLRGHCAGSRNRGQNSCFYDHRALKPQILLVLIHKARNIPCDIGSSCDDFGCINGHNVHRYAADDYMQTVMKSNRLWHSFSRVTDLTIDEDQTTHYQPADTIVKSKVPERETEQSQAMSLSYEMDEW